MIAPDLQCFSFADARETSIPENVLERISARRFFSVAIRLAGAITIVSFTDARAADIFAYRYSDMISREISVDSAIARFYVVADPAGLLLWSRPERGWLVPQGRLEPHIIAFFADNALMMDFIEQRPEISMHSAVLASGSRAFALVGISTAGKSTTAVACAAQGMTFYSDERCLLQAGWVKPFPRALTLRPNGRRRLLTDDAFTSEYLRNALRSADGDDDFVVPPSRLLPDVARREAELRAIFIISGYGNAPKIEAVDLYTVLPELMLGLTMRERGLDRMARAMKEFSHLRIFRLQLGEPVATARAVINELQRVD